MNRAVIKQMGKDNLRKQWGELLLALVLVGVAGGIVSLLSFGLGGLVVAGPLSFGTLYLYYKSTQGEQVNQKMLLEGFRTKFGESFLAGMILKAIKGIPVFVVVFGVFGALIKAITTAVVYQSMGPMYGYGMGGGISVFGVLGFLIRLAFCVAAIYVFYGLCMAMYILMREPDMTAVKALKKSWAMTKGQKGRLFVFDLSYIGWYLLAGLTLGILLIWVAPYYQSAKTVLFNDIYDNSRVAGDVDFDLKAELRDIKGSVENSVSGIGRKNPAEEAAMQQGGFVPQAESPMQSAPAAAQAAPAAAPEVPAAQAVRYCKHCGAPISESAMFCNKCGGQQ